MNARTRDALDILTNPIGWLKNAIMNKGLEWFAHRYYAIYPGVVIDNADPQNRGRVRALCPEIRLTKKEDVSNDFWMVPCMNGLGVNPDTGQMTGMFHPPDVGTNIWIQFEKGDPDHPIYMGGWVTNKNESDTFSNEDALKKGIRTATGHYIRMNDDPEDLHLKVVKGDGEGGESTVFLDFTKEGHVTVSNGLESQIHMNGEEPEVSLTVKNGSGVETSSLVLGDDVITLSTKSGGSYEISGRNHTTSGDKVTAECNVEFYADSNRVKLGKGASEPAVKGNAFTQWVSLVHQHTMPTPIGTTAPGPNPPPLLMKELSGKVTLS